MFGADEMNVTFASSVETGNSLFTAYNRERTTREVPEIQGLT